MEKEKKENVTITGEKIYTIRNGGSTVLYGAALGCTGLFWAVPACSGLQYAKKQVFVVQKLNV